RWQLVREDRNKDEVVDAENDLKDDKGPKTDPDIRIRKKFHDDSYKFSRAAERKRPRAESPRPSRCALVIGRGLRWHRKTDVSPRRYRSSSGLSPSSGMEFPSFRALIIINRYYHMAPRRKSIYRARRGKTPASLSQCSRYDRPIQGRESSRPWHRFPASSRPRVITESCGSALS